MVKVTCNGCFDGLHPGHAFYLGYCKAQGDILVVGINSDEFITRTKRKNAWSEDERKHMLIDTGIADRVVVFHGDGPSKFIQVENPDVHCIGEEYRGKASEEPTLLKLGIKIVYVPRVGEWSTTWYIKKASGSDTDMPSGGPG